MIARIRYLASRVHAMPLGEIGDALADLAVGFDQRGDEEAAALADLLRATAAALPNDDDDDPYAYADDSDDDGPSAPPSLEPLSGAMAWAPRTAETKARRR